MTHRRKTRQQRILTPAGHCLVMLLTMLALVVTPLGNVLATPAQQGDDYQAAQDANENPPDENPNEIPPEPVATEAKPTEEPPVQSKPTEEPPVEVEPTEVPVEVKPTEVPPVESKPTEQLPDETKPTEEPPVDAKPTEEPPVEVQPTEAPAESKPTEQPAIDPTPDEAQPTEPSASATPPALPPNTGGPRLTGSSTLVMVTGLCDYRVFNYFAAANLAQLLANCIPYSSDSTFTYTSDTGTSIRRATSGSTTSFWVPDGGFSMQAQIPSNHHGYVVGCESTGLTAYPLFRPGNGSTIRTMVDPGATLTCFWFSSPVPPTTITLIKGLCDDPGFDPYSATSAELAANCTQATGDATFTYQEFYTELTLVQTTINSTTTFLPPVGSYSIREDVPAGFGQPVVSCQVARAYFTFAFLQSNVDRLRGHMDPGDAVTCQWYNVPLPPTTIVVTKGLCDDPGFDPYTATSAELAANCTQASGDATFTYQEMYTGYPNELTLTQTTSGSTTTFVIPNGNFSLREDIPAGFGEPVVSCHIARINWTILPSMNADTIQGHIDLGDTYTCQWYNVTLGSTSHLTVRTWECPPGYDHLAPTANPMRDCTQPLDGVEYQLEGIDNGTSGSAVTGENTPGVVRFLDLEPGNYTITETLPTRYATSFVWTCTGAGVPAAPTMPMATGVALTVTTLAGWNTTCHWFNVQESGSLTVIKYSCGPSLLPDWSQCPIYKQGQGFDLLQWTGDDWVSVGTGTTDRKGRYTWTDLAPGDYVLEEAGRDWCRIRSDNMSEGDKAITVESGQEAIVYVYNCTATPTSPPVWVIRVVNVLGLLLRDAWNPAP